MSGSTLRLIRPTPTLFGAPGAEVDHVVPDTLAVVGMPSDWTHSSRIGTRFGPHALREATRQLAQAVPGRKVLDPSTGALLRERSGWIADCGDADVDPGDVAATTRSIAVMTAAITARGAIPLALGGDHYNSYPAALGFSQGLKRRAPGETFGYIQIDGHLDYADRLGAWGTHNHATNARRIAELPNVRCDGMVWVGVTGWVDGGEVALIEERGGRVFTAGDVHREGPGAVMAAALAHARRHANRLYVSIDIDAMDAGFLPGTGSIVHSGLTPRQYGRILDAIGAARPDGIDFVECSPPLDPSGRTERICAAMLERVLRSRRFEVVG